MEEKVKVLQKDQDDRLTKLFSGEDDEPRPAPEVKPQPEPEPPKKEEPKPEVKPEPEPVKKEGEEPEEGEVDFTKPPEGAEKRESLARQRAAENGRKLQEVETKHRELELEYERVKSELEVVKKTAPAPPISEREILARPEISTLRDAVVQDRDSVAMTQELPLAGKVLVSKFGDYMTGFVAYRAEQDEEKSEAMDAALRGQIADDFRKAYTKVKGDDVDNAEMESGVRQYTRDVISLLVRNAGKVSEMEEKISSIAQRAREGTLAQNVEVYRHHHDDLSAAVRAVEELPQEVIDQNPHAVEATVAVLIKDPVYKKRFEQAQKTVLEMILGPRALTQEEIDRMKAAQVDYGDFNKKRQKAFLDNRRKNVSLLTQALFLLAHWEETSKDAAAYRDSNSELVAINKAKDRKPEPPPPKKEEKRTLDNYTPSIEDHLREVEGRR